MAFRFSALGHLRPALCLFALVPLAACPSDEPGEVDGTTSEGPTTSSDPTTTMSTSSTAATTDASSSSSEGGSSSSSGETTTTDEGDTSSSSEGGSSSSTGGPVCDPGTANCPCDEGACEGELECMADVCLNPMGCLGEQTDMEPNDDEGSASVLPDANCGALNEVSGSSEMGDVDYYAFDGVDLGDKCPQSDGTIAIVDSQEPLEVCLFFACDAGAVSVNCGADDDATSPDGLPGCCGIGNVEPDQFCTGIDNNGSVELRVGGLEANACVEYSVAYRFQ